MDAERLDPPREFTVGDGSITLRHCANVRLEPDEQLTFVTESGTEVDVVRKEWGYYGTPSLNGRLADHGLRAAIVMGHNGKAFLHLVEKGIEVEYDNYLDETGMRVIAWLDTDEAVSAAADRLAGLGGPASPTADR